MLWSLKLVSVPHIIAMITLQGCRQAGVKPNKIFKLIDMYYVYKQLPQKDVQNLKAGEEKTAFRL